mmetsp:Transcript_15913/g.25330  ORF Transcript_15913/g.25330 Transcript_15913/m.25330 type:complete len:778 (-) Transcript_15913:171-2504(-)
MRVRHLQSHLMEQSLIYNERLDKLRGVKIGIDAVYWLRSIQALKDPFADALGGVPPGIFGFVDKELESFRKNDMQPFFIFQGIAPGPQHSMFISRMDAQMENAWTCLARGQKSEAQKCFAVSTSRINGDFVYFIFHHLRAKGCEVLMAPYFAGAQLAHFAQQNVVQAVFGPPGLLLYNIQRVIFQIDFSQSNFDWVDLQAVLTKWQLTKDQFVDACMLAGTEYCLTFPYLNPAGQPNNQRFNFEASVHIIKQSPIIQWMQTFPNEEMKNDHVHGYCTCKVLAQSSPVLHSDGDVRPLGSTGVDAHSNTDKTIVPKDFHEIMGEKLPNSLYYLMMQGVISHKLPQALARGEWVDKSQPLVDTSQFRELLQDMNDYRQKALCLVAKHLHPSFSKKQITCKAFWDQPQRQGQHHMAAQSQGPPRTISLQRPGRRLRWKISKEALVAEQDRQGSKKVDLKFCLNWHAHEFHNEGQLYKDLTRFGENSYSEDRDCLCAMVHFMLLEHLELISEDGGMTVFADALKGAPAHLMEPSIVAIELMKFGQLNSDPFDPGSNDRPFPSEIHYPKSLDIAENQKSIFLLTRVMSLVPMRLKIDMWNADVNFDLAAFHAMVRILKRSLRQLTEASLASVLMKDLKRCKLLPPGFMCSTPKKEDHLETMGLLPTFMLPRACMGIVVEYFLKYKGEPQSFIRDLQSKFPCCTHARLDLMQAFIFWEDLVRCVEEMAEAGLEIDQLRADTEAAGKMLKSQQKRLGLIPEASVFRGDEHPKVKAACGQGSLEQ